MGKQTGRIKLRGTFNNITYYKWRDEHYARAKSSLTGERVKTDPRFKRTMANASLLVVASRIASAIYRQPCPKKKGLKFYRELTGTALRLLRDGMPREEVKRVIKLQFDLKFGNSEDIRLSIKEASHTEMNFNRPPVVSSPNVAVVSIPGVTGHTQTLTENTGRGMILEIPILDNRSVGKKKRRRNSQGM